MGTEFESDVQTVAAEPVSDVIYELSPSAPISATDLELGNLNIESADGDMLLCVTLLFRIVLIVFCSSLSDQSIDIADPDQVASE